MSGMKKAVILHATEQNSRGHWYPWLKKELEHAGYEVWVPDLPDANRPDMQKYLDYLLGQDWDFTDNVIIGHSSGAVTILGLLQHLPAGFQVKLAVPVGSFSEVLASDPDWKQLKGLFEEPMDFTNIKQKAKKFIFVHGSDDPWCPIEQAKYLQDQVGGEMIIIDNGQHFSTSNDPKWKEFPELLKIIKDNT